MARIARACLTWSFLIIVALAGTVRTAAAESNGKIAFSSWKDGYARIYVMNADGSGVTALTDNVNGDYYPAWSPDGTKIAFASNRDGEYDLWLMNADGTDQRRLYDSACTTSSAPAWSPDGGNIIVEDPHDCSEGGGVFTMVNSTDGSVATHLSVPNGSSFPSWSPDSTKIAFSVPYAIYVMGADGSNLTQLTSSGCSNDPEWSPDGTKIVFFGICPIPAIFLMNADGNNVLQLTSNPAESFEDFSPTWSPDGTRILFSRYDWNTGDEGIWMMDVNGNGQTNVGALTGYNDYPSWQPVSAPATPAAAIQELITLVNTLAASGQLTYGNGVALTAKLHAALQQLAGATQSPAGVSLSAAAAGGSGGSASIAAKGQLGAFINQVNALVKSRRLSQDRGQPLIEAASAVIASL